MTTQKQIEANRRNARDHATGPKTPEGKKASRRNALKHGLSGDGVVFGDEIAAVVAARRLAWNDELRPEGEMGQWLAGIVAFESVRIDRCHRQEAAVRSKLVLRANLCWDDDRTLAAAELALMLPRKPEVVSLRLRRTAQGCDWIARRWRALADLLDLRGYWDGPQYAMALDLLGIPLELRGGPTPLDHKTGPEGADELRAVAEGQIAEVEALRAEYLDDLDGAEQVAAQVGDAPDEDPVLRRLQRYEADSLRRLKWAMGQIAACRREPVQAEVAAPASIPSTPLPRGASDDPLGRPEWVDSPSDTIPTLDGDDAIVDAPASPAEESVLRAAAPALEPGSRRARRARRRMAARR